mgnify:CR=1 FL=1
MFSALPPETAGPTIRRAFPHFYLFVIGSAALGAALVWSSDAVSALVLAAIALTTVPARQTLMPAINAATDAGDRRTFGRLHGLSVVITAALTALGQPCPELDFAYCLHEEAAREKAA